MSDVPSSLIFAVISLIPANATRYIALGVATFISCVTYLRVASPHIRLDRLDLALNTTTELLKITQLECALDQLALRQQGLRLLEAKLSASLLRSRAQQLGELHWYKYLEGMWTLWHDIGPCERTVTEVRTVILLTIEAERQRKCKREIYDYEAQMTVSVKTYLSQQGIIGNR
ncbi:hypothetical protein B0H19DRAFT_1250269 [Mycena capillaripes]|nr:hypothetical protein B0H19DRAFT_1250269 [Mycena capillaripes]